MTDEELRQLFKKPSAPAAESNPAPEKTATQPEKTATQPEKTVAAPEKTAAAPEKTAAAPEKTAAAPEKTAAAAMDTALQQDATHKPGDQVTVGGKTYTVEQVIGSGAEGDIYLVTDKKKKYALKLCHPGFKTNEKVLQALDKMKDKHVHIPRIVSFGPDYELLEYIEGGSAAKLNVKGNAQAIMAIALEIALCLDCMHKAGVLHKDVKPANILIKDQGSWDCVLCDFGIATILDQNGESLSLQVRTPTYAAPEIYDNSNVINLGGKTYASLTPKADFFSLGMTILSLWMGEGAFRAKEEELAMAKIKGRIPIPADMPDPLAKIVRGLLIRNPQKRWDLSEIKLAIEGKDVPVEEDEIIEDLNITYNAGKHQIANTPEELAIFMAEDLDLAKRYLYGGKIEKWLKPYPELSSEMYDITENRYPKDKDTGVQAAIFFLKQDMDIKLQGVSREDPEVIVQVYAVTLKDVSNFFNDADPDVDTADLICSDIFREWVRVRSKDIARKLPTAAATSTTMLLRIQTIDPLSDINLINKPEDPDYAMTGEGLGKFLNEVYTIFWNCFEGDIDRMNRDWESGKVLKAVAMNIAVCFLAPDSYNYIKDFFATKNHRFDKQDQWYEYCLDRSSVDYQKRCGPKDNLFFTQSAWMRCIQGWGFDAEYEFVDSGKIAYDHKTLFSHAQKELYYEYHHRGLKGFLAILNQEDPNADLSEQFAYEDLLWGYVDDVREIDDEEPFVVRFDEAADEAERLLKEGRGKIRRLNASSITQTVLTIVLAIIPALVLLGMLVFSIIENPIVDVSGFHPEWFVWILGGIIAIGIWVYADVDGCLIPIAGGLVSGILLVVLVKVLGMFILYFYAALVLAVLVWFSIKTVFNVSPFAKQARKFVKPGFDEKVLEPLYYAFGDDATFDSSLNGAFNDNDLDWWKSDLKVRRRNMFIFIGSVWLLMLFSGFIPKSRLFEKVTAPIIEKVSSAPATPDLIKVETLSPGAKGEDVVALQQFLLDAGYVTRKPDGDYGPGTKKAVQQFQKANGLDATGVADYETLKLINKLAREMEQNKKTQ